VGGRLYQAELEGAESARIAIRILHGEPATNFPPRIIGPLPPTYDWRELRRWKINDDRLPHGSVVKFREPTMWDRYGTTVIAGISVCAAQGLLIFVLVANLIRRRRAECSLRESEERMKLAAVAAGVHLWEWDIVTDQVWFTGPTERRIGSGFGQRSNYDWFLQTVHPDDRDGVVCAIANSMNGDGNYARLHRRLRSNGQIRWIVSHGRVEFDSKRKPVRMRGVYLDITARKEAEDRAQESERRFLLMANSAPVLIWSSGPDKACTFFNQTWLEFTGRKLDQELGNGWTESVHPDDLPGCLKTYEGSFDARRTFTMEYRVRRHDGQYRWISDHGVPRYDAQKNFLGYIGSCVDVTERKEAEADAQRSRQELAHVTRVAMLGELAGSLAHELNQPLTAILTNAQAGQRFMAARPPEPEEVREILNDIAEEGRRAAEVIVRVRAMLKKDPVQMVTQDLNVVIGEVLGIMRSDLIYRNVAVVTRLPSGLPFVQADRVQLQQVLLNLILNSCEAMNETPANERGLTIETERANGSEVQVSIADRGPGFAPEALPLIFEPFRTTKANGLGLGLPICRSIINAHGGRLWAMNNHGRGATLIFTLPARNDLAP
jgi:PAS domain S-box-containing protein